jgi:hypothetical protein
MGNSGDEPALTGRWQWQGEAKVKKGRRHYTAAGKTFDGAGEPNGSPLLVRLGDGMLVYGALVSARSWYI